ALIKSSDVCIQGVAHPGHADDVDAQPVEPCGDLLPEAVPDLAVTRRPGSQQLVTEYEVARRRPAHDTDLVVPSSGRQPEVPRCQKGAPRYQERADFRLLSGRPHVLTMAHIPRKESRVREVPVLSTQDP